METKNSQSNDISLILCFIDDNYRSTHSNILDKIQETDIVSDKVLHLAKRNKVVYYFVKRVLEYNPDLSAQLGHVLKQGEANIESVKKTLGYILSLFSEENIPFLVLKTFKGIPFITEDIDIIVKKKDYQSAAHVLESRGATKIDGRFIQAILKLRLGIPDFKIGNLIKVDMYQTIPYLGLESFDEDFLWKSPRIVKVYGETCQIPSREADLLSLISSNFLTNTKFTLLDFLYLDYLLTGNIKLDEILEQTKGYGWHTELFKMLSIVHCLHRSIYQTESIPDTIHFPYEAPLSIILPSLVKLVQSAAKRKPKTLLSTLARVGFNSILSRVYVEGIKGLK